MLHQVYLGLGSNLGDRENHIRKAVELIGKRVGTVLRQSSLIETEPWGFQSENRFLNCVILCTTKLTPQQVLEKTQAIEQELGKRRRHATRRFPLACAPVATSGRESSATPCFPHYSDRPIDIDILLYDDLQVDEPNLKIPHPLMQERDFVMIPLREIKDN